MEGRVTIILLVCAAVVAMATGRAAVEDNTEGVQRGVADNHRHFDRQLSDTEAAVDNNDEEQQDTNMAMKGT